MIQNDAELQVVRQQLHLAEDALIALRSRLLPRNAKNYEVFSESYIDMIWQLRGQIDEYLGLRPASVEPLTPAEPPPLASPVGPAYHAGRHSV